VTFLLTAWLLRLYGANQYQSRGILLLGLASPFVFYTITFWEHTLAVSLSTTAFALILGPESHSRMRFFLAGIIVGVSTIFRKEGYVFFNAIVVSILFTVPKRYTRSLMNNLRHAGVKDLFFFGPKNIGSYRKNQ
jgi:hypothetical protein